MLCKKEKAEKIVEKMAISNLLYLAQSATGFLDYQKYTQCAVQLMQKAKLMPFDRKQIEWKYPELTISRSLGCKIRNRMRKREDFYVFFYDGERQMECGSLNGITMLRDEDEWIPVRNDFMEEVMQSESFHMIGIEPYLFHKQYASMVRIAKELQEITKGTVEIIIDSGPGLYVIPSGQGIRNKK